MQEEKHSLDCSHENEESDVKNDDLSVRLQKSLDQVIKKEGYIEYNVKKNSNSTEGGNYMGILTEIDITGKTIDGDKDTNIFVKQIIPENDFEFVHINIFFHNEAYAYKELLNIYNELQDKANIPVKERFNVVQSFDETNDEAIILENLSRKGFKTLERMKVMPIEYAELSIKQLAKFHGLSMVLQNQSPDNYCQILEAPKKPIDYYSNGFRRYAKNMIQIARMYLSNEAGDKLNKYTESFIEKLEKHWDTSAVGCCICHGDYRGNNVMYKELDGVIQEVIVIDFQMLHYGRPINDFMTLMFLGTDRQFRKKHLDNLKNLYYESLETFLKYFSLDVNQLYPRQEYEVHFQSGLEFGLLRCLYTLPMLFIEVKDVPDLGKIQKLREVPFTVNSQYEERIQGIVDDCIEWNIIKDI